MNYILGAGGFAKEVLFLFKSSEFKEQAFNGFIDFDPCSDQLKIGKESFPLISEASFLSNLKNNEAKNINLFIGIGNPELIHKILSKFDKYDFNFPNLISQNATLDMRLNKAGKGNIITSGTVFTVDIELGSFNIFNLNSTIGHDTVIGSRNVFNPGANISGGVKIGDQNLFGTNSTVLQYHSIGSGNTIGANALVNKDIEDNETRVGVPAKRIK